MKNIEEKLAELQVEVEKNSEQSNSRMERVNQMFDNLFKMVGMCTERVKVLEEALRSEQESNRMLIKNNGELIQVNSDVHARNVELEKEIGRLFELLRSVGGNHVKFENKQA